METCSAIEAIKIGRNIPAIACVVYVGSASLSEPYLLLLD